MSRGVLALTHSCCTSMTARPCLVSKNVASEGSLFEPRPNFTAESLPSRGHSWHLSWVCCVVFSLFCSLLEPQAMSHDSLAYFKGALLSLQKWSKKFLTHFLNPCSPLNSLHPSSFIFRIGSALHSKRIFWQFRFYAICGSGHSLAVRRPSRVFKVQRPFVHRSTALLAHWVLSLNCAHLLSLLCAHNCLLTLFLWLTLFTLTGHFSPVTRASLWLEPSLTQSIDSSQNA